MVAGPRVVAADTVTNVGQAIPADSPPIAARAVVVAMVGPTTVTATAADILRVAVAAVMEVISTALAAASATAAWATIRPLRLSAVAELRHRTSPHCKTCRPDALKKRPRLPSLAEELADLWPALPAPAVASAVAVDTAAAILAGRDMVQARGAWVATEVETRKPNKSRQAPPIGSWLVAAQ